MAYEMLKRHSPFQKFQNAAIGGQGEGWGCVVAVGTAWSGKQGKIGDSVGGGGIGTSTSMGQDSPQEAQLPVIRAPDGGDSKPGQCPSNQTPF